MNKGIITGIFLSCVVFSLAFAAPRGPNLASNPGFELRDGAGLPESWRTDEWNSGLTVFSCGSEGAAEGASYASIESRDEDDAKLIQDLRVEPNSLYRISVLARASGLRPDRKGAYVTVLGVFEGSNEVRDTKGEWKELELYGKTAKGQKRIELCLRLGGYSSLNSGLADFDSVRVEKIDTLPAGAKAISLKPAPASKSSPKHSGGAGSDPLAVFLSLLGFCALAYLLDRSRAASALDSGHYAKAALIALLAVGLAMRLPFSFGAYGYRIDLGSFKAWAAQAVNSRIAFFYRDSSFADYPPGYVYVLAVLGALRAVFALGFDSPAFDFLIRLPAIACDLGLALVIREVLRKRSGEARAIFAAAIFLLNPLAVMDSAVWGQVDSVFCLALVASLACLSEGEQVKAGVLYGVAALVKPQAFIFAPVFLLSFLSRRRWKDSLLSVLAGIGTVAAGFLPFLFVNGPLFPFKLYAGTLGSYPYASLNAANLWAALGYNAAPITAKVLGIAAGTWGTIAVAAVAALSVPFFFLNKRADPEGREPIFETAAFLIAGAFAFSVKMHERYLYPILPLLVCAWAGRKSLKLPALAAIVSLICFLNVSLVYRLAQAGTYQVPAADPFFIALSVLAVAGFFAAAFLMRPEKPFDRAARDASPPGRLLSNILDRRGYSPVSDAAEAAGSGNRAAAVAALTVLCLAMGLIGLGDVKVPQKGWKPKDSGETVVLDLGISRRLESFSWYSGIGEGEFTLRVSDDGIAWKDGLDFKPELYSWKNREIGQSARFIELKPKGLGAELLEIAFWGAESGALPVKEAFGSSGAVDEQGLAKKYARYADSMVFDEIYHGRTAFEHLHSLEPYEWTHPPLGKLLIAAGVGVFGMGPWGWRIVCALFGALLVPLFYLLARKAFPRGNLALGAAAAYAFDFMRFTQTRLALVDGFVVFFVLASYAFMYRYYLSALAEGKIDYAGLALSGLFFGLGAATKWNAVYSGTGLAVVFFIAFISRLRRDLRKDRDMAWKGAIGVFFLCIACYIILPAAIYVASYLPTLSVPGHGWDSIWKYQGRMFTYHSTLNAEHSFASPWWQWPWLVKPVWYFKGEGLGPDMASTIVASGNPLIWIPSLAAAVAAIFIALRRRDLRILPAILGFFAQYLPWVLVPRLTFLYHYFPILPFGLICLVYCVQALREKRGAITDNGAEEPSDGKGVGGGKAKKRRLSSSAALEGRLCGWAAFLGRDKWIWIYAGACALLFIAFLPALSGMIVPKPWIDCLRWSPSWFF